ncbi:MAG: TIGR02530 family flagellar biosynthesis protein [Desulfuromonadales bacterium]|nr:TIGR02530 family flagellar biosynthesis protein [Desulfuromonadales bacterium]MDW7757265.1 TIGR02530 family flagellar biosynthesis protein [Desulfuromonadales bacterium]
MNDKVFLYPRPILPSAPSPARPAGRTDGRTQGPSFDQVLQQQLEPSSSLRFSKHALSRMESRGIQLSPEAMNRLEEAVKTVDAKGSRDSLVLLDQTAMVVSVKNSTVVTVVDRDSLKGNVFTNIDSAIIA